MNDLISRQSAIDLLKDWSGGYDYIEIETEAAIMAFQQLQSAQPERKVGKTLAEEVERIKCEITDIFAEQMGVQPEQQWTPCSEGVPMKDGGWYLVTDYSKSINRRRMHVSRCYVNNGGFWTDVPLGYKVVAWMPLPEPYKGEGNEAD